LFNGQGEPQRDHYRAVKFPGRLHSLIDKLGVKYIYADATGPMARYLVRNYRHWLWVDDAILIFDDLESHEDGVFDWLLHYEGTAAQEGSRVALTNGSARARIQFLEPADLEARELQGLAEHDPDRKIPYLAFRTRQPARVQKFITAILPYPADASQGAATVQSAPAGENSLGVRIERGSMVTDVYLNLQADGRRMHQNSNTAIAGWETDAYLLGWTRPRERVDDPQAVSRFFVSCASYLRREGRIYLDSLSKVEAVWQPGKPATAQVIGQPVRAVHL
ncbi:MAG: hypothetical protein ACRD9L_16715, partial [Bryobacteraceae bacterium]